jgi:hypothetical protein
MMFMNFVHRIPIVFFIDAFRSGAKKESSEAGCHWRTVFGCRSSGRDASTLMIIGELGPFFPFFATARASRVGNVARQQR